MSELSTADRLAIHETLSRYCHCVDGKRWDEFKRLFTPDCCLDFSQVLGRFEGHDGIQQFCDTMSSLGLFMRHLVTNVAFRFCLSAVRSSIRGLPAVLLAVLLTLAARPVAAGDDGDAWRSGHPDADVMDPDEIPFPDAKPNSPDQIPFPDAQPRAHDEIPDPDAQPRAHDEIDFPDANPRDPDEVDVPDAKPRAHDVIPFPDAKPRDPDEIDPDDE